MFMNRFGSYGHLSVSLHSIVPVLARPSERKFMDVWAGPFTVFWRLFVTV